MKWTKILGSIFLGTGVGLFVSYLVIANGLLGSTIRGFIVTSGSMEPTLPLGSVVFTKSSSSYNRGDIITFAAGGNFERLVTHRIIAKIGSEYTTSGDASESIDRGKISDSMIIGKSFFVVPYLGYGANFVRTPKGFLFLIIVPATIVVYEEIKNIVNEIRKAARTRFTKTAAFMPFMGVALLFFTGSGSYFSDNESPEALLGISTEFDSGGVVINEVYYDPDSERSQGGSPESHFEWVELYNASSTTVNLKDWKIVDNSGNEKTIINSNRDLLAGEFVVIAKAANVRAIWGIDDDNFIAIGQTIGNGLANTGDRVILKNSSGEVIDAISYGTDTAILNPSISDVPEGSSIERSPTGADTDAATDFIERITPTPGS